MKPLKNFLLLSLAALLFFTSASMQAQSRHYQQGPGHHRYQSSNDDAYGRRGQRSHGRPNRYRRPMPPVPFFAPPPPVVHHRMLRRAHRYHACYRGCGHRHPASCRR